MKLKGQYFSFDAIIASVIFILALVSLLSYWHSLRTVLDSQTNDITKEALRISEVVLTPGYPDTPCDKMDQLGFAISWQDRRLSKAKMDCAHLLDETALKQKFSTPYNITIIQEDGLSKIVKTGIDINGLSFRQIAKVRRIAPLVDKDNIEKIVAFDIYLYQ